MLPTHAGDTSRLRCSSDHPSVHPRSRGEHSKVTSAVAVRVGSSPLARGTPASFRGRSWCARLIPARAGNTIMSEVLPSLMSAHPRSRGEHHQPRPFSDSLCGSSPLARGTHRRAPLFDSPLGLIPARAGNTFPTFRLLDLLAAHPRSRGEHSTPPAAIQVCPGSSPLARGTLRTGIDDHTKGRLIPARAGNTWKVDMMLFPY